MKFNIQRTAEDDAGGEALDLTQAIAEFASEFPECAASVFILNHQKFDRGRAALDDINLTE